MAGTSVVKVAYCATWAKVYENAGHAVAFEQADAFLRLMNEEIVPATYGNTGGEQ
jgi:hypothetical protein